MDKHLFESLQSLPSLPFYSLIKQPEESAAKQRKAFLQKGVSPIFEYPKAKHFHLNHYRQELDAFNKKLHASTVDETIKSLYQQKLDELQVRASIIEAVNTKNDERVHELSLNLFGPSNATSSAYEKEFKNMPDRSHKLHVHKKRIDAEAFAKMVRKTLDHYSLKGWRIQKSNKPTVRVQHKASNGTGIVYIPKNLHITASRAVSLLAHEIEVHVLRSSNGMESRLSIIGRGLDRYLRTEEGLATFIQYQASKTPKKHAPGFWDAWTTTLTDKHSFAETFSIIKKARTELATRVGYTNPNKVGEDAAWRLCMRAFRGITDPSKPGRGFYKSHIYRSGFEDVKHHLEKHPNDLELLFAGNIGIDHIAAVKSLGLKPKRLPEQVSRLIVTESLKN